MVLPGIGSHSPNFQSSTRPDGVAIASGVSCSSGTGASSLRTPLGAAVVVSNDHARE